MELRNRPPNTGFGFKAFRQLELSTNLTNRHEHQVDRSAQPQESESRVCPPPAGF